MKRVFLMELFHEHQLCTTIFAVFPFFPAWLFTCQLSTVSHISSWHINIKFSSNFFASNILISIHLVYNAQIFFNWQQLTFCAHDMFNNFMFYSMVSQTWYQEMKMHNGRRVSSAILNFYAQLKIHVATFDTNLPITDITHTIHLLLQSGSIWILKVPRSVCSLFQNN